MTSIEFNKKYEHWLEDHFYGLAIDVPEIIDYLDKRFQEFVKRDDFKYQQIKLKFGSSRFYADGVSATECDDIEFKIDKLYKEYLKKNKPTEFKYK